MAGQRNEISERRDRWKATERLKLQIRMPASLVAYQGKLILFALQIHIEYFVVVLIEFILACV